MKLFKNFFHWIKRHKVFSILGLIIFVALIFVFRPKAAEELETTTVKKTNLVQSVAVNGTIASEVSVDLPFLVSGELVYVSAKKGDTVKKYQTIAALDQRTLEKNIENAVKNYQNEQIDFDIVNDFNGDRSLSDTGLSIDARRQLETALNTLDQAQIAVEIQRIAKEQAFIVSPIDGILTRADAQVPGMNVTPATTYSVADPTKLLFKMEVDEADIGKVAVGQKAKLTLDAYPDDEQAYPVEKIDFVSHTTTNGGNAFYVDVKIATASARKYRVGMNGIADIITGERKNVLTVPISSIVDEKYVYIKTANGYEKRNIKLGLQNDVNAEVTKGLSEGDVVVDQPAKVPKNGNNFKL